MQFIKRLWNSPLGPKTTHFWGPALNFGFVIQGLVEWNRPPQKIGRNITMVLAFYSLMGMRFAQKVSPFVPALFVMHICNFTVQSYHVSRRMRYEFSDQYKQAQAKLTAKAKQ